MRIRSQAPREPEEVAVAVEELATTPTATVEAARLHRG
jgi:hypothetical protein